MADDLLLGRKSVLEALKAGREIDRVIVQEGPRQGSIKELLYLAGEKGVPVNTAPKARLDAIAKGTPHQGVAAFAAQIHYREIEDALAAAAAKNEPPFLVLLAGIQDPHNTGAIIRTAAAAGAHGALIPEKRGCQITPAVMRAAAGGAEHIPIVRIGNITGTLKELKKRGLWIVGADAGAGADYREAELDWPLALVIGGEDKGMARLVRETCDIVVRIPMPGKALTLNASVAAALLIYEVLRKRGAGKHL
ncbi:MAG: 23S rRNA (guanosine(2251)-2'-O)-methyltransferase RlmB [Acidaminococcales bacterium]|jgi:23S rRNA (guanosine2251-2'-O)-methyltransferase|nr:23S rRNA (guanosine(2251)-2'-O)-methyltransferase RlmB [Acidaminococcales bacterium]